MSEQGALPHNIEAEQGLLGALLMNNDAFGIVADKLDPADFFEPLHREIFRLVGDGVASGRKVTPITIKDALPQNADIGGITIKQYIARLCAESTTVINAPDFAKVVRELSTIRDIISIGHRLEANSGIWQTPSDHLAEAFDRFDAIRGAISANDSHRGLVKEMALHVLDGDRGRSITTTLTDLDRTIAGGFRTGRLFVVGARPSMGKTALMASVARRMGRRCPEVGVSIFSLETDQREIIARMISDELSHTDRKIPYRDLLARQIDDIDVDRIQQAAETVGEMPIVVDESAGLSMTEIEARIRIDRDRFAKQGKRLGLVCIDYLGLVRASDRYRGQKVNEVGEVTAICKQITKKYDVCMLLFAQLNREVEKRDDKRPSMSDLRDAGTIEQDADFVGFIYRPLYYIERSANYQGGTPEALAAHADAAGRMELILAKNRLGGALTVNLYCDVACSAVDNWSQFR